MRILFISSGRNGDISVIVKNQGESLKAAGIDIDYCIIKPGLFGYLSAIPQIRSIYKKGNFDLAHAHYSLSGFAASLAGIKPLVVSLMGSDALLPGPLRWILLFFAKYRWDATIVKTTQMKETLGLRQSFIIPNGVNLERFKPMLKSEARKYINYPPDRNLILFIALNNRPEKNFDLASKAVSLLNAKNIDLWHISNVANEKIHFYLNAADLLLLTSKYEGSVNVIKEAMACNCPVVSTKVGDVEIVLGDTQGCKITSFDPENITENIRVILELNKRTNGLQRILDLGLDSHNVAQKVIAIYEDLILKAKVKKLKK